jgi:DNA-binding LacI/PurR family transcriptional regulator
VQTPLQQLGRRAIPTVGLLVDCIEDGYQWPILRGAVDAARDAGAHLLCFAGGALGAPAGQGGERNMVFELATPESVDALVVFAGAIGNRAAPDQLLKHFAGRRMVPACSVAIELPGMSSVCIDNAAGMRSLVEHLIHVHRLKSIAFVRGPAMNPEAERRFDAYSEALAGRGLAVAPELVVSGDFEQQSGREAVRTLLVERKVPVSRLEAIVAANDAMALGVLAELADRHVRVPEEVALAGFDDIEESRFTLPPLTTVRQPLYEQGRDAVRLVLHELRDGSPREHLMRHTEPVVRRSCRCLGQHDAWSDRAGGGLRGMFEATLLARRGVILAEISRAARGQLRTAGSDWGERLLNAFAEQMRGAGSSAFEQAYDGMLRRVSAGNADVAVCNDVVSALRAGALRCLENEPDRRTQAENLFHDARIMTSEAMDRVQAWRRLRAQDRARAIGRASAAIASAHDEGELQRAVSGHLPKLGIERCYVAELFGEAASPTSEARLLIAYAPDRRTSTPPPRSRTVSEILRQDVPPSTGVHAFTVLPIGGGDRTGVLILEFGGVDGYLFEVLRDAFVAAFRNIHAGAQA